MLGGSQQLEKDYLRARYLSAKIPHLFYGNGLVVICSRGDTVGYYLHFIAGDQQVGCCLIDTDMTFNARDKNLLFVQGF
jgi:hypothetical protein